MRRIRVSLGISVAALAATSLVGPAPVTSAAPVGSPREYVITFDPGADVDVVSAQVAAAARAPITRHLDGTIPAATITTSVVPEALNSVPGVLSADLNAEVSTPPSDVAEPADEDDEPVDTTTSTTSTTSTTAPNPSSTTTTTTIPDPVEPTAPWGLDRSDQRELPLSGTYKAASTGAGIKVYVVDTGISPNDQFGTRLAAGVDIVRDGLGTADCEGHGTHVAGTIGGADVGMAPGATIVPVRALDCDGKGDTAALVEAFNWILADHPSGPGVVNMSLGAGRASTTVDLGVEKLIGAGLTVVTSAGNDAVSSCNRAVGTKITGSLVVGATNRVDRRAGFSDFGPCVDIFAPGERVVSAGFEAPDAFEMMSGTSMAAPHVAGAAAVLLGLDPWRTPADVEQVLIGDATPDLIGDVGAGSPNRLLYSDPGRTPTPAPPVVPAVQAPAATVAPPTVPVTVLAATTTRSAPVQAQDVPLAFTGGDPRVLTTLAAFAMAAGALMLVVSRRRRDLVPVPVVTAAPVQSQALPIELIRRSRR